jgi:hypothetical protein
MAALANVPDASKVRLQEIEDRRRELQRQRAQVRAQQGLESMWSYTRLPYGHSLFFELK